MSDKNNENDHDFQKRLATACQGLVFVSETDSEVTPFLGRRTTFLDPEELLAAAGINDGRRVSVISFEDFLDKLTQERDWHTERHMENSRGFRALKLLLAAELSELTALKIGEINIDFVLIGRDKEGRVAGVKMHAIET